MAAAEKQLYSRNRLISSLLQIKHPEKGKKGERAEDNVKKLELYLSEGLAAAKGDPDLLAHFIAWDQKNGKLRDSRVALPVIALRGLSQKDADLAENAIAHLLQLSPRDLVRAYSFNKLLSKQALKIGGGFRPLLEKGLKLYLEKREESNKWWDRSVLRHRESMKRLYRLSHKKPSPRAQSILFDREYPLNSVFGKLAALSTMTPVEAASVILEYELPFEVAAGALRKGEKDKSLTKEIVFAMIEGMTGNQIITNSQMLQRYGVMSDTELKAAFEAALERAKADKKTETLKAGRAAEQLKGSAVGEKLAAVQEVKTAQLGSIQGDWLVLGDRSGSMKTSMEVARQIAGLIAERVSGAVHLVFFDTAPTYFEVSGKSYAQIVEDTRRLGPGGSTSIGCGLDYLLAKGIVVNGIAIASDGGENQAPYFAGVYRKYAETLGIEPTIYLFRVPGDSNVFTRNCTIAGIQVEEFDLSRRVDSYSLPNIVTTLRANRYALFEEIMNVPLLTIAGAFERRAA